MLKNNISRIALILLLLTTSLCSVSKGTKISKEYAGINLDGDSIFVYTLSNGLGTEIEISNFGGIVMSLKLHDINGDIKDVVLGYNDISEYIKDNKPHFGALIGRYANRISNACFKLDGRSYKLEINRPPHHLHGGDIKGFDRIAWKSQIVEMGHNKVLCLSHFDKDGTAGYPGNIKVEVKYSLNNRNEFKIEYNATTDRKTVLNMTNHSYFNLSGFEDSTIHGHNFYINSQFFIDTDSLLIPTGEILNVDRTDFDFRKTTIIRERLKETGGFDVCYKLNKKDEKPAPAAVAYCPSTGIKMTVYTNQPGLQFYTGNFLNSTIQGKYGQVYHKHSAFCFETQNFPDAPNNPNFPNSVLMPEDTYHHLTTYKFELIDGL